MTSEMSLLQHLDELRKRLIRTLIILIAGGLLACPFSTTLYRWLQTPLQSLLPPDARFIALTLTEGWVVYFQVACIFGAFFTAPLWGYQLWSFLAPGLLKRERKFITLLTMASTLLFLLGVFFCYRVVMPLGFAYLVGLLQNTGIVVMPQMQSYLTLVLRFMLAFGVVFQLPLIIFFLIRFGIVDIKTLQKYRRHMIVAAFILGALLTPPDVVSQTLMSVPIILLFELGLLAARLFPAPKTSALVSPSPPKKE